MKLIICLDDDGGMLFNHRRQSRDSKVVEKIIEFTDGCRLWVNEYSAKLFDKDKVCVSEDALEQSDDLDYCFVENVDPIPYADKASTIYIFKWNRKYPSDMKFEYIPSEHGMRLTKTEDFAGTSHDKIIMEVWERNV